MKIKNGYANRARISESQFGHIVRMFSFGLDITLVAALAGHNRSTTNRYLRGIREHIAGYCGSQSPSSGKIAVDKSCIGPSRIKGKRGSGAFGETAVFSVFWCSGSVYTEIVEGCINSTIQAIIRGQASLGSIIYSDGWRGYNVQDDIGYGRHLHN